MKIALVDDDKECLAKMTSLIENFSRREHWPLEIVPFQDAESFLSNSDSAGFTAVFMDIYMQNMDGITAARQLRKKDPHCFLVFLTSSSEFMPSAFACHAFEYITKPFRASRINAVLEDIKSLVSSEPSYLELRSDRQTIRILCDEILSVVSEGHYLHIATADGNTVRTRMTIREFLALVKEDARFLAINKGIVVNMDRITEFEGNSCLLDDGSRLPVRVRDRRRIEQEARDYAFSRIRNAQHRKGGKK